MNNNPNENVNQQTSGTTPTPSVAPVNNSQNVASTTAAPAAPAASTPVVTANITPTAPVPSTVTPVASSTPTTAPAGKTGPVAPQQNRVQLIDDKPKLHAVIGGGGEVIPTSQKQESTEVSQSTSTMVEPVVAEPQKKGGKFQTFFLVVLFGGLLAIVVFLPDISNYIETQKYLKDQQVVEKITTGTLTCSMENSTENLDYTHSLDFGFTDNKLTRLTFVSETRGDVSLDETALDLLKAECDQLATNAKTLDGITVSCNLQYGTLTKKQTFNYANISVDDAMTAYVEAGGAYPDYENGESIDSIEKEMNASGYTCERIK